jgi:hypothetical protein
MYSDMNDHLVNLEHCGSRNLRCAYLVLLLAAERSGYRTRANPKGAIRELHIRDDAGNQPFAVIVNQAILLFYLRRPALDAQPGLAGQATSRFPGRVLGDSNSLNEVRIRIDNEGDAEDIAGWLFATPGLTHGYEERRSA